MRWERYSYGGRHTGIARKLLMSSGRTPSAVVIVCCTLLLLLTANWATTTLAGVEEPLYLNDFYAFGTAMAAALVVQLTVILVAHTVARSSSVTMGLTALFCVANAWSMHLLLVEGYMALPSWVKIIVLGAASLLIFLLLRMASHSRPWFLTVSAGVSLFIIANVASYAYGSEKEAPAQPIAYDPSNPMTASEKIKKVRFERTPNVYLIGFESAGPASLLKKHLGLSEAPLPRELVGKGFRVFPNAFSEGSATRVSWHALLAMDADYGAAVQKKLGRRHLFSGAEPSPLMEIFKYNGYEITTLYSNSYLGTAKGPYIDRFVLGKAFSPCDGGFILKSVARYLFWGGCYIRSAWFPDEGTPTDPVAQLVDVIVAEKSKPQLIVAHTDKPLHTPTGGSWSGNEEDIAAFREQYAAASVTAAARLDRIFRAIRSVDPSGIILVFGDHGPALLRATRFEQDPALHVHDRYGVLAGVHPKDACKETFDDAGSIGYYTTPELARLVIKCLAGGEDPFVTPYAHHIRTKRATIDLGKYPYE